MREAMGEHRSRRASPHAARGMLAQEGSHVIDGLSSVEVPALIIVGDQISRSSPLCEYMAKKIPGARLEVIAGAGTRRISIGRKRSTGCCGDFLDGLPAA